MKRELHAPAEIAPVKHEHAPPVVGIVHRVEIIVGEHFPLVADDLRRAHYGEDETENLEIAHVHAENAPTSRSDQDFSEAELERRSQRLKAMERSAPPDSPIYRGGLQFNSVRMPQRPAPASPRTAEHESPRRDS